MGIICDCQSSLQQSASREQSQKKISANWKDSVMFWSVQPFKWRTGSSSTKQGQLMIATAVLLHLFKVLRMWNDTLDSHTCCIELCKFFKQKKKKKFCNLQGHTGVVSVVRSVRENATQRTVHIVEELFSFCKKVKFGSDTSARCKLFALGYLYKRHQNSPTSILVEVFSSSVWGTLHRFSLQTLGSAFSTVTWFI